MVDKLKPAEIITNFKKEAEKIEIEYVKKIQTKT